MPVPIGLDAKVFLIQHFFHHHCRKPFILKSRRSLVVLRPGQSKLLFQNSHGLTRILHFSDIAFLSDNFKKNN